METTKSVLEFHPSVYGTTAPSGPWPPSIGASILLYPQLVSTILIFVGSVMHSSGRQPILVLVFLLISHYGITYVLCSFYICLIFISPSGGMSEVLPHKINLFTRKLDLTVSKKSVKCCIWSTALLMLKLGHFGK